MIDALDENGVALIETLKVIGEKGVRITPDIMASGGSGSGIGTLLLLNLFLCISTEISVWLPAYCF